MPAVPSAPVVAFDTSALMAPVEANVRLFEELDRLLGEYEAVVPDAVVAELDRLRDGGGKEAMAANVGVDLARRCERIGMDADGTEDREDADETEAETDADETEAETDADETEAETDADETEAEANTGGADTDESYADDVLVDLAAAGRVDYVVTNDGPLQDRILARDVPVIGLRGRNTLAITEP